ncbi:MAG: ATP-dependent DNA helicase RecQ, partial [Roseobacter sp. MedPE-SW]
TIKSAERRPAVKMLVSEEDAPLLSALKAKRRALAEAQKVPAYVVFNDKTLIEMAETRPETLDQMARIGGVGAKKLDRYGDEFLEVITGAVEQLHPQRRKLATRAGAGSTYDALMEAQTGLIRGSCGTLKPLSCPAAMLAKLAQMRVEDTRGITMLLGERRAERFLPAFLDVLRQTD